MIPTHRGRPPARPDEDIFDQGLAFDLQTMLDRRQLLKLIGYSGLSAGLFALAGCGSPSGGSAGDAAGSAPAAASTASAGSASGGCALIPEETAGPFPGDGSNGPDVLGRERRRPQRHPDELRRLRRAPPRACR